MAIRLERLDILKELAADYEAKYKQQNSGTAAAENSEGKSYKEIWSEVQEKQKEWNNLMQNLDVQEYKFALMDRFWNDNKDVEKLTLKMLHRQQENQNQQYFAMLTDNISSLQHLQYMGTLTGDEKVQADVAASMKALNNVMQQMLFAGIKTSYSIF